MSAPGRLMTLVLQPSGSCIEFYKFLRFSTGIMVVALLVCFLLPRIFCRQVYLAICEGRDRFAALLYAAVDVQASTDIGHLAWLGG
eukprot:6210087-Pleurochrysis_carterae.AAC.4